MYRAVILAAAQHPRHHGLLTDFDQAITVRNPSCGDVLHLQIREQAGRVEAVAFSGSGSQLSLPAAS